MPPKGEKRKQQIVDTAKEMFMTKGFQSTHIGQVCEKLDIARGTVYQYFSNKKEILYAILDSVAENMEDILDPDDLNEYLKMKPEMDVLEQFIDNRVSLSLAAMTREPIVIKLIYRDIPGVDDEVTDKVTAFLDRLIDIISKEIELLRDHQIMKDTVDPFLAASMLVGAVMMIIYQYVRRRKSVADKNLSKQIALFYLHGVYNNQ